MTPHGVLEACLYVNDLEAAETFYTEVLGLDLHSRRAGRHVFFHCGPNMVLLFQPEASLAIEPDSEIPPHGASGPGHMALLIQNSEFDAWQRWLGEHDVAVERTITWPNNARSIYFRDPSGNSLELATPTLWEEDE